MKQSQADAGVRIQSQGESAGNPDFFHLGGIRHQQLPSGLQGTLGKLKHPDVLLCQLQAFDRRAPFEFPGGSHKICLPQGIDPGNEPAAADSLCRYIPGCVPVPPVLFMIHVHQRFGQGRHANGDPRAFQRRSAGSAA